MTTSAQSWSWKLGLASWLVIIGAIASGESALAQITPDNTLGSENSTFTSTDTVDTINGGATRGANLFHSFGEFNVDEGRAAVFTNPAGIENILTRVTGANPSNIFGTLGVAGGNANLFLINPNGIVFGPNARLDVGGAFVGTTANVIGFGNQGFFNATNPNTPALLTVNPSAFFFNQIAAAPIQNNSVVDTGLDPSFESTAAGLRVSDGKSLLLVGGDINMDGGGLYAFGGRVELGGLAGTGTVGLNGNGNNLSLSFPERVERSDVSLSNGSLVDVTAGDRGSIAVNARNIEMTESGLFAGIGRRLGSDNSKAGNIEVNATGTINLDLGSKINNEMLPEANGRGGDVNISATTLQIEGGAQVTATTRSRGKGGNLTVNAQDVQVIGEGQFLSALSTTALPNSTGDAGDVTIKTNTLLVRDGAQVTANTHNRGKGGNLTVDAAQDVQVISAAAKNGTSSVVGASALPNSTGDAGDVTIKTNTLLVRDGAQVGAFTSGKGKGGNLTIDAQDVQVIGESADGRTASSLLAAADSISIGNAGDVTINTQQLLVQDGADVTVSTFGTGKGGNLTVNATDSVRVIGKSATGPFPSSLSAQSNPDSTGNAGDVAINTQDLLVKDGAQVTASTFGTGKGGNLTVNAADVQVIGESANSQFVSALNTAAQQNSTGDAGDLTIRTNTLLVQDGAQVGAGTFGAGKGGNLTVEAQDVQVAGESVDGRVDSSLFASAEPNSTGDAGNLTIKTNTLLVRDGAEITVESLETGIAGNFTIDARSIRLDNYALLTANTQSALVDPNSEQATININSQDLVMRRNSNIFTNATGGNVIGGNINIDTDFLIAFENSDISANSANFRGGNVRINASGIFGTQFRDVASDRISDITATGASPEFSGNVELNTPDTDLNSGLVNLPTVPVDTEVAQACTPGGSQAQSEFVVTGRGGLPPNPTEALSSDAIQIDWVTLNPEIEDKSIPAVSINPTAPKPALIIEAQGWVMDNNGEVLLTATAPTATPLSSWQTSANCHGS